MKPVNKNLLVEKVVSQERDSLVLIPEASKKDEKFSLVKVLETADDCTFNIALNSCVVVLTSMIDSFVYNNEEYLLVPQSSVMAIMNG
jgi:co-chaperonin GroES (HSP10)